MYAFVGFLALSLGWLILIYAGWRNQRAAKKSPIVDDTNFGVRIAAIIEVVLHPDRAATWEHERSNGVKVFPQLGMDSSERYGIRPDDGKVT